MPAVGCRCPRKLQNGYKYSKTQRSLAELEKCALSVCFPSATSPTSFHCSLKPLMGNSDPAGW